VSSMAWLGSFLPDELQLKMTAALMKRNKHRIAFDFGFRIYRNNMAPVKEQQGPHRLRLVLTILQPSLFQ
jgi:hypothetical protein